MEDKMYLISELKEIAIKFRCAIEKAIQAGEFRDSDLEDFPNGCCNYISDCLQRYLYEHRIETLCVFGKYGYGWDSESHVWLVTNNNIIIDITGDQYKDNRAMLNYDIPVFVGEADEFHKLFEYNGLPIKYAPGEAPNDSYRKSRERSRKIYNKILKFI